MKKLLYLLNIMLVGFYSQSQDTLYSNNQFVIADSVFGLLNPSFHEGKLLNRSMEVSEISIEQMFGSYNQIHDLTSWQKMYDDIVISHFDTTKIKTNLQIVEDLLNFNMDSELRDDDELRQPFGFILQEINYIDTNKLNNEYFDISQHQLIPKVNENTLYDKVLLKSCAILELNAENGYREGRIIYDKRFISTSQNIKIESLKLSVDNMSFQDFNEDNNEIIYPRSKDSTIAKVAVHYLKDKVSYYDTLSFYITTQSGFSSDFTSKSSGPWDDVYTYKGTDMKFRVAIKYGCGNNQKIKRPIIIAPPYRPSLQAIKMSEYYNQFNFESLFSSLSNLGYDVIFLKEKPGNMKISVAGRELANFITEINEEKAKNFPNEDWENILIGFSAGGQHARYALMYLEEKHMNEGGPHHHTRLYIPFDSPHLGANVPMFTQAVYHDHRFKLFGVLAWHSLNDDASKDMLMNHYTGSNPSFNPDNDTYSLILGASNSRIALMNQFENSFTHAYTNSNDLRKYFPSFTRNIAISTGRNDQDYNSEYGLTPGKSLFQQNITVPSISPPGIKIRKRNIKASNGNIQNDVFWKDDITMAFFVIPIVSRATYRISDINSYNWDMSQGGYKNEFYDKWGAGIVPIAPIALLRMSGVYMLGNKIYDNNMNFLPLISAFNINPDIWSGSSDVFYDVKEEGLMFKNQQDIIDENFSETFGYPHLDNPTNHFNITPFEAVYADPQTYEHIKMQASVEEQDLNQDFLIHLRNFILDEVEGENVYLQNKIIGQNHLIDQSYRYKAWYKAENRIYLGNNVTPKTDSGDYIIEKTGDIKVYAGDSIIIKDGFHVKLGGQFHCFIKKSPCYELTSNLLEEKSSKEESEREVINHTPLEIKNQEKEKNEELIIYPNPTNGKFTALIESDNPSGVLTVYNSVGLKEHQVDVIGKKTELVLNLSSGIYFITWDNGFKRTTSKLLIR